MSIPARHIELAVWLLLCGGLATAIGVKLNLGSATTDNSPVSTASEAAFAAPELSTPFVVPPPDHFLEVTLRPLFISGRSVPIAPANPGKSASDLKDQFIVTGTLLTPEKRFVQVTDKSGNRVRMIEEGTEIIPGAMISTVSQDDVEIVSEQHSVRLSVQSGSPGGAAARRRPAPTRTPTAVSAAPAGADAVPATAATAAPDANATETAEGSTAAAIKEATAARRPHRAGAAPGARVPFPWEVSKPAQSPTPAPAAPTGNEKQ